MRAKLTLIAGIVAGLALLATCFGAALWLLAPERFPVTEVELRGNLKNTAEAQIRAALPRTPSNFFVADLNEVRVALERLPWVRRVEVRRVWPARLEITLEEHVALARWGDDALVSVQGQRFSAKTAEKLPAFVGPGGTEAEVARRYRRFSEIVAPLGTPVERVVLTQRHAWQLRLGNGLQLMLGRDADLAEARLRRFVEVYPTVGKKPLDYVDLRYPNGFALRQPGTGS